MIFKRRYFKELENNPGEVEHFLSVTAKTDATLLFGSREIKLNNANALKTYLVSCHGYIDIQQRYQQSNPI